MLVLSRKPGQSIPGALTTSDHSGSDQPAGSCSHGHDALSAVEGFRGTTFRSAWFGSVIHLSRMDEEVYGLIGTTVVGMKLRRGQSRPDRPLSGAALAPRTGSLRGPG